MAGGILKGFGVVFIVLGAVAILGGLAAALLGGYVANEEDQRGIFADREKGEAGMMGAIGGLAVAGLGLIVLLLGILLFSIGASRARRELLQAMAGRAAAGPPQAAAPAPAPIARHVDGPRRGALIGGILLAAILVLGVLLLFQPGLGGEFRPLLGSGAESPPAQVATFEGHIRGGGLPVAGSINTGDSEAIHTLTPQHAEGVLRASANWTEGPGSADELLLILEAQSGDGWEELKRGQGGPGVEVEAPSRVFSGDVRVRVFVAGAGAADMDYALTLTILPRAG